MYRYSVLAALLLVFLASCAGSAPSADPAGGPEVGAADVRAFLGVGDLAVGTNRFSFVLLEPEGAEISVPVVDLWFFYLGTGREELRSRVTAPYHQLAVDIPHVHEDGQVHAHEDVRGYYLVPEAEFDSSGQWGAAIFPEGAASDPSGAVTITFEVKNTGSAPAVGASAPASVSPVASTEEERAALSSRVPPADMHRISIHEALKSDRPLVVIFASPRFCQTRICGPVLEVAVAVQPQFDGEVYFIHIEPFDLKLASEQGRLELSPVAREWNLPSEPWIFVIDRHGKIAARFEGMVNQAELVQALEQVLRP